MDRADPTFQFNHLVAKFAQMLDKLPWTSRPVHLDMNLSPFRLLTAPLTTTQRKELDPLLQPFAPRPISKLAWLRQSPGEPSASAFLAHIECLQAIRALRLSADIGRNVHQNRLCPPDSLLIGSARKRYSASLCSGGRWPLR